MNREVHSLPRKWLPVVLCVLGAISVAVSLADDERGLEFYDNYIPPLLFLGAVIIILPVWLRRRTLVIRWTADAVFITRTGPDPISIQWPESALIAKDSRHFILNALEGHAPVFLRKDRCSPALKARLAEIVCAID
jgi:hypothetical protein